MIRRCSRSQTSAIPASCVSVMKRWATTFGSCPWGPASAKIGSAIMASLTEDELYAMERAHRADETERCAQLCTMRANISRASAAKLRRDGSYTVRCLWPLFQKRTHVAPKWENAARD